MRRVLITGATTPIGRAIVEGLAANPMIERVLAIGAEPDFVFAQAESKATYRRCDLTRSRDISTLLLGEAADLSIDAIVHSVLHRSAHENGERIHALNVESTREILRLVEDHPTVRRLVFRSTSEIYRISANDPSVIGEDHPLRHDLNAPEWLRDRVEADLTVCARMGMSKTSIAVLRCAECLAPGSGSQLYDYLSARICFRPLGFDPMLNLLSIADLVAAHRAALCSEEQGVFNIPGRDVLPLSRAIALAERPEVPVPGFVLSSIYRVRHRLDSSDFRYELNEGRFHFGGVLDGRRAREKLGYQPATFIDWRALGITQPEANRAPTASSDRARR